MIAEEKDMGFLRRIFGGSGSEKDSGPTDTAWHFYVKSKYADEIIDIRVDPNNDLSPEFDGAGDGASHYTANKDIVGAIVYLSSDAASYTTGQNIIIDGGMSSW